MRWCSTWRCLSWTAGPCESSLTAHIPVVVVSALSEARDDAFTAGCDAFLLKPCAPDVVYLQVRALMRLRGDPLPV